MKNFRVAVALITGVAAFSPNLHGQAAKPSPYSGVSQPPPDETITADDAAALPSGAKAAQPTEATPPAIVVASTTAPAKPAVLTRAQPKCNPDFGVVGDPSPCADTAPQSATVKTGTDLGIMRSTASGVGGLPEGTIIQMSLNEALSTEESRVGGDFSGLVIADVVSMGKVAIPQGSQVFGKVVRVTEGHRFGGSATIRLRPDVVVLPDGSRYVVRAQIIRTSTKSRIDAEGTMKPASHLKTNVIKEGAGIGTGAVAGALIGGGPGALVGSIIGAGVMTTNILVQSPASVKVPKDSTLTLSLTEPMVMAAMQASTN